MGRYKVINLIIDIKTQKLRLFKNSKIVKSKIGKNSKEVKLEFLDQSNIQAKIK